MIVEEKYRGDLRRIARAAIAAMRREEGSNAS
jgi:hypothetical protein